MIFSNMNKKFSMESRRIFKHSDVNLKNKLEKTETFKNKLENSFIRSLNLNVKNLDKLFSTTLHELNDISILIFDDVFHQGFTFARITELLQSLSFREFKLITIARTVLKSFLKTFYFP